MRATNVAQRGNKGVHCRGHDPLLRNKKKRGSKPRFFVRGERAFYCAPILTSVTSKIRVSFGGNPFFGSEP
jgi:hypothetical protein